MIDFYFPLRDTIIVVLLTVDSSNIYNFLRSQKMIHYCLRKYVHNESSEKRENERERKRKVRASKGGGEFKTRHTDHKFFY